VEEEKRGRGNSIRRRISNFVLVATRGKIGDLHETLMTLILVTRRRRQEVSIPVIDTVFLL
jgi:hypothetical protein